MYRILTREHSIFASMSSKYDVGNHLEELQPHVPIEIYMQSS
jgi:hypothetical protein